MKKAYVLDLNILATNEISLAEFCTLLKLIDDSLSYPVENSVLQALQEKSFIKIVREENEEFKIIREKANILLSSLEVENLEVAKQKRTIRRSSRSINNDLDEFLVDFRLKWKGLKPGSMGSLTACREKMTRWMKDNPQYSKEDIMRAATTYINSLNGYTYLQAADYFIYKKDAYGESSRLSAFVDEAEIKDSGWSTNLN